MTTDAELDVNILVVDDLAQNLLAMEALLARPGVRVIKASSGVEALELLLLHEVAVALLDVQMPEMDGFELAELIRGRDSTRHIPLMFVTAAAADQQRQFQGYDYGAVDFLHKPVESHVLISKVNVFIELYRQQRHIRLQNARLSETLQLNEMFVAVLAHDLRVPLTAMSLGVRLLRDSVSTPPASALLERVEGSAARMGRMIEQLLDLSRIRSGLLTLALRSQDLAALAEQALHELDPTNSGRLSLTVMGNTQARVDLDRWQQVLTNFYQPFTEALGAVDLDRLVLEAHGLENLSLERILGWVLAPLAWIMGVPWHDAVEVGSLLGIKTVLLGFGLDTDDIHSPNEHYGLFNFYKGIETIPYYFMYYAEMKKS